MNESSTNAYDAVHYPGHALPQTHPDRLAVLATLFGLQPAPVEGCRVLELGCGEGNNLIPMAWQLPESQFTGVDLAAQPIASGRAAVDSLGLKNIELRQLDIMDVGPDWGEFDYIIAHGLYSWVPPHVQDKLLAICGANLAPDGVAYVSYNTLPGGHLRQMMREMMLFHTRHVDEPAKKIAQAVDLVSLLEEGQRGSDSRSPALRTELEKIRGYQSSALLYHDDMADSNTPVYFHQFAEHSRRNGLQFLAESDFFEMQDHIYPQAVQDMLRSLAGSDVALKEQYLDFLKCRRFRQTLLCRQERVLERELRPERLVQFAVASRARPASADPDVQSSGLEEFRGPRGAAMRTDYSLAKAAMCGLGEAWPRRIPFRALVCDAYARLGLTPPEGDICRGPQALALAEVLLGTYSAGLVDLHLFVPKYTVTPGERPEASELARWQIEQGISLLTSQAHTSVKVEDRMGAGLIRLLDGTRDRAALARDLTEFALAESTSPHRGSGHSPTRQELVETIARDLERSLNALALSTLLVR